MDEMQAGEEYEAAKDEHRPDWTGYEQNERPTSDRIKQVLVQNGVDIDGGSFHSWRCFDKERYPEPCTCTDEVVAEIMAVVGDALRASQARAYNEKHHDPGTRCDGCHSFGFEEGVQAARDAVRNTPTDPRWNILQIQRAFLAAIDALRGES